LKAPACAGVLAQPGSAGVSPACSLTGAGFLGSPCVPSSVSGIRTLKLPLLPVWEKGAGGMGANAYRNAANRASLPGTRPLKAPACAGVLAQPGSAGVSPACSLTGAGFLGSPCVPSSVSGIRTLKLPLLPVWEKGAGGMGANAYRNAANRASLPGTRPLKAPACAGVLAQPGSAGVSPACSLTGAGFLGSPCVPSCVSGFRMPKPPFSPCGRRRLEDEGQTRTEMGRDTTSLRPSMIYGGRTSTHNAGEAEEIVPIPVTSTSQRILHRASLPGGG